MSAVIDLYSERCLDLREAGRFLGLCTRTVVREIQRGKLRAFSGRTKMEDPDE
jgi:hypothetical protein